MHGILIFTVFSLAFVVAGVGLGAAIMLSSKSGASRDETIRDRLAKRDGSD